MIVTITGANDHLRKSELAKRVAAFIDEYDDMAVERFDGEEASTDRMREALQSMPFLSARKLVVLREPGKQKAFAEDIATILEAVSDATDVILYEPKLDKRSSYYKTLKKQTEYLEFATLDTPELIHWIQAYTKEQAGTINLSDTRLLVDRIGPNQQLLKSELDKLLGYSHDITKQTIELLTEPMPQSTVFELLDAAFAGKTARAFDLYHEQRSLKVEPQAIIAMLVWQLHILAVVKAGSAGGAENIAKTAKLNPFVVRKSQGLVRNMSFEHIKRLIADLLQLDRQLKSTAIDADEALQLYFMQVPMAKSS